MKIEYDVFKRNQFKKRSEFDMLLSNSLLFLSHSPAVTLFSA